MTSTQTAALTPSTLVTPGTFITGCNYWASHAGTQMWRDWQPQVVEGDFRRLSAAGLQVLRVFPLWPDFQPITAILGGGGALVEYRHGEDPLPDTPAGQAGMSEVMLARFGAFLDLMDAHGLRCIVGLLTGWMSGRLHVPPALNGRNVLTDLLAIRWELRFVRAFVERFRHHPAILGWDLGNECNCMAVANREQAYTWSATIANAIRVADPTRPVVSGMHSLTPTGDWTMQDQGEVTDLLTTHPYPFFTPHCDQDPVNTLRTLLHGTAESRFYADLGGKPCLCQETGTLGPMNASEAIAADFTRACLFSLWANDCHGMLWWCANEQTALTHAPYDWCACERELGLLRTDGTAKPHLHEFTAFQRFLATLPIAALSPRRREAVCILTRGQDTWGVAYSAFILAKQAGFDLEFQYHDQPMKEADLYLLPCLAGYDLLPLRRQQELLARVEAGATLYLSLDNGLPSHFAQITGLEAQTRERRRDYGMIILDGLADAPQIPLGGDYHVRLQPTRATILGREADVPPAFSIADYGQGKVYFLNTPLEMTLTRTPGAFHAENAAPCWRVYQTIATDVLATRAVRKTHPMVAVTEHNLTENTRLIIAINESPVPVTESFTLADGWTLDTSYRGELHPTGRQVVTELPKNDAVVFVVKRAEK